MKFTARRGLRMLIALFCAFGSYTDTTHAQAVNSEKMFIFAASQGYLIDLDSQSATRLQITWIDGNYYRLSPDGKRLAVVGNEGLTIHYLSIAGIQRSTRITQRPTKGGTWSKDGKTLLYTQETEVSSEIVTVKIFLWDAETGETKRLL